MGCLVLAIVVLLALCTGACAFFIWLVVGALCLIYALWHREP